MPPRAPSLSYKVVRLALVIFLAGSQVAQAGLQTEGQWTAKKSMAGTAINLNLVPGGTSPYHSRILWWDSSTLRGMWGWRLQADTCAIWADSNFVDITSPSFPTPPAGMDIFCSGATTLPDGRLIVVGGNEPGETGITKAAIFDADAAAWTALTDMANRRWYPTATVMADGRVFVSGGSKYFHMLSFGGQRTGDSLPSDSTLSRFGTAPDGVWDSAIGGPTGGAAWPSPRSGQTVQDGSDYASSLFMFGGQNQNGTMLNDAWFCYRDPVTQGTEYQYNWIKLAPVTALPNGRRDHIMVRVAPDTLVVMGGRNTSSTNAEVWTLTRNRISGQWSWTQRTPSGTPPSARYGHTAVVDGVHKRVLMYGGNESIGGAPSDTLVWSLSYASLGGMRWSNPVMRTSASPGPRFASRASLDPVGRKRAGGQDERRALLFGGMDENGALPTDLWAMV